jgi:hypothetical protein
VVEFGVGALLSEGGIRHKCCNGQQNEGRHNAMSDHAHHGFPLIPRGLTKFSVRRAGDFAVSLADELKNTR